MIRKNVSLLSTLFSIRSSRRQQMVRQIPVPVLLLKILAALHVSDIINDVINDVMFVQLLVHPQTEDLDPILEFSNLTHRHQKSNLNLQSRQL